MNQLSIPSDVTEQEIIREHTLGGAISLCVKAAGYVPKDVTDHIKADKAQYSRWVDDKEGILWPKLEKVMDHCGNDAPILWMLYRRGYDLRSLRKRETETEMELRLVREQLEKERMRNQVLVDALHGRSTA